MKTACLGLGFPGADPEVPREAGRAVAEAGQGREAGASGTVSRSRLDPSGDPAV